MAFITSSIQNPHGCLSDELIVFLGHSDDALTEASIIYKLQSRLQDELDVFRRINPKIPFSKIKIWEWAENASSRRGGQKLKIDPIINQAQIALFIFKDRIGEVTWEEIQKFRNMERTPWIITIFPKSPEIERINEPEYAKRWATLLSKKKELTKGWGNAVSSAITVRKTDEYGNHAELENIVFRRVKDALTELLSWSHLTNCTLSKMDG
jgi:hypothetical protein